MPKLAQPDNAEHTWSTYFAHQASQCRDAPLQRFYAAGLPGADTPLEEVPLVAMDFETTGMDPRRHTIVSIGVVPFTLERIRPADGRYWVVRPQGGLWSDSVGFHGITHSEVENAPTFDQVLDELLEILRGRIAVVHYHPIERPFLDAAVRACRANPLLFPIIDTMVLETRLRRHGWRARLRRFVGLERTSYRLADTRVRYALPNYSLHNAKLDAVATAELLQAQIAHNYSPQTPLGELWL